MIQLNGETYGNTTLITCAEYQVFLDEQRAQGKYYQPDHWTGYRFSLGQGHAPVLGVRPTDASAFCKWLTAKENGPWRYRLPKEDELHQEAYKSVFDKFGAGLGYWLDERKGFIRVKEMTMAEANALRDYVNATLDRDLDLARDLTLGALRK